MQPFRWGGRLRLRKWRAWSSLLASDDAAFMTGSEVLVDGGLIAAGTAHMRAQMQKMLAEKHAKD